MVLWMFWKGKELWPWSGEKLLDKLKTKVIDSISFKKKNYTSAERNCPSMPNIIALPHAFEEQAALCETGTTFT